MNDETINANTQPKSMSILQAYPGNMYGGIERLLVSFAKSCKIDNSLGIQRHFAVCFEGRLRDELLAEDATVHDLGEVRFRFPWTILAARKRLRELNAVHKFTAIITHSCWIHSVIGPEVKRLGVPLIHWVHDTLDRTHVLEKITSMTKPDLIIANSHHTARSAEAIFPNIRKEVLYHPLAGPNVRISDSERTRLRKSLGAENRKAILIASRLERWKGHQQLFNALTLIANRTDWVCWFAGGPQRPSEKHYYESLRQFASANQLTDQIRFLGQRSDIADLMQSSDILCQPNSGPEPFGVVFIEALYAGLPVITSRFGGAMEIINDTCGILTDPGNSEDVAKAIVCLLSDNTIRNRMACEGPSRADELCNPNRQIAKLKELLASISAL